MAHIDNAILEKDGMLVEDYRDAAKKGVASIKSEYLIKPDVNTTIAKNGDDDAAEASTLLASGDKAKTYGSRTDARDRPQDDRDSSKKWKKKDKKDKGQNKNRQFGASKDALQLCGSRQLMPEFSPKECQFGSKCKFEHDLRKYLKDGKREDLTSFGGICPLWEKTGFCPAGWKCRFVGSHSKEINTEDGRKELVLVDDEERMIKAGIDPEKKSEETGVYNAIPIKSKIDLERRRVQTKRADEYTKWLSETWSVEINKKHNRGKHEDPEPSEDTMIQDGQVKEEANGETKEAKEDSRATYREPPFRASEKRRLYYGPDTPVLAPLTTQGNMPFRRLCVELGAQITWSEMAMSLPLIQGNKGEWPLVKAHASEISPPVVKNTVVDYDNKVDMKFGVQISANKPWLAFKATEILSTYCSHLRAIDLNCGCPIDMVYETGAGSALLANPSKLEKMLRGMNALSGDIPITAKIRTGVKDNAPNAASVAERLIIGGQSTREEGLGSCGIAALTLHGRSRQQRYTKLANWSYIADIASMIKDLRAKQDKVADTVREADPRDQANGGKVYFIGNGDVYSHIDYNEHIEKAGVDSIMIARGALIKPWIFEEISSNQYMDKSASERLTYIEKFCKNGMDTWGSDEMGIGTTRRFLCEWLSFTCRYVPIGLLEHLPPMINERAPLYKGRNELETLMASDNYRDWIKISEMFLGPAHENFTFTPKHKSNAYESIEAEG